MIRVDRATLVRAGRRVLDALSLEVPTGQVVALLGPSGSGKTTLLRALLGFLPLERGSITLGDTTVTDGAQLRVPPEARGLAVVFQDLALWPHLTVAGNLEFVLASRGLPAGERRRRIEVLLARVGLGDKLTRYPAQLSGGEQQRVAIARALVLEPRAVLFDEPLANLDALLRRQLQMLLRELLRERGATSLYVTHDLRDALSVADSLAVLEQGRVTFRGPAEELRRAAPTEFISALLDAADAR